MTRRTAYFLEGCAMFVATFAGVALGFAAIALLAWILT